MIKALIYNSDIKAIQKKAKTGSISADEAELLQNTNKSESQIQRACYLIFQSTFFASARFVQIDNGGKMGISQRMKKAREGTQKGMKDVMLIGQRKKIGFVEFKKIGSPMEIDPEMEQKETHNYLIECGFKAWYCNNTVYFKKVICNEFKI